MTVKEKMTAPIASVGADVEQPSSNKLTNQSIADLPGKGNLQATNNAENTAKSANEEWHKHSAAPHKIPAILPPATPLLADMVRMTMAQSIIPRFIPKSTIAAHEQINVTSSKQMPIFSVSCRG